MPGFISFLTGNEYFLMMNKRFVIVGIALGIIITIAVIVGSPAMLGFDSMR